MTFTFVSPTDGTTPATTDFFSISPDPLNNSHNSVTLSAYGLDGNLLGTAFYQEHGQIAPVQPIVLQNIGRIHRVVLTPTLQDRVTGWGGIAFDLRSFRLLPVTNLILSLDGNGSYMSVQSAADLQSPSQITIEAWIYPANLNQCQYIVKGDNGSGNSQRSYEMFWGNIANGAPGVVFDVFLGSTTYATLAAAISETNWTHIAATYESAGGVFQLYTNGNLAVVTNRNAGGVESTAGLTVRQTTFPLNIGGQPMIPALQYSGGFAGGYMDEIRIWTTAAAPRRSGRTCRAGSVAPSPTWPLIGLSTTARLAT